MGYKTLEPLLKQEKLCRYFFPEDPFSLDELAKKTGVVAVMDCKGS